MNLRRSVLLSLTIISLLLATAVSNLGAQANPATISQPTQPTTGPGSSERAFLGVQSTHVGDGPAGAKIFMPKTASPTERESLPVVLFIHGFSAVDTGTYGGWIDHLVQRGAIVIYPDYQTLNPLEDGPANYVPNLFTGIRVAIESLQQSGISDIRTRGIHVVGHSLGAVLAVRYAQDAERLGFSPVLTLMVVQPGGCNTCGNFGSLGISLDMDRKLPSDLLAQVMVGSDDSAVGDADARSIWPLLSDIPATHRDYVTIVGDTHGNPPMIADHNMVGTGGPNGTEDAMDWFALWRPFDALIACADSGDLCSTALGDTPEHRYMGTWSDGMAVKPLVITDGPT